MANVLTYRTSGNAPIRVLLEAKKGELALFGKEDIRQIVSASLMAGFEYYRWALLPQLFTGRVYRAPFNYHVTPEYAKRKAALGLPPLVGPDNPNQPMHLRDAALNQSKCEVIAQGAGATYQLIIRIPGVDHANFNPMVRDTLRTVPAEWIAKVAQVASFRLEELLAGGVPSTRQGGPARVLTGDTRSQIGDRRGRPAAARKVIGHA